VRLERRHNEAQQSWFEFSTTTTGALRKYGIEPDRIPPRSTDVVVNLAFGLQPVVKSLAMLSASRLVNLVRAFGDSTHS
jgi:hypothetical protein